MGVRKNKVGKSLTAGRPPSFRRKARSMSRKATKALINRHHLLEKRLLQAISKGDETSKVEIEAELEDLGGLERYQQASLQGQRKDRGGDSSRILMDWIKDLGVASSTGAKGDRGDASCRLRMLEVGALSTDNACSKSGCFDIERIDLNSQGEGILQQDFMKRPLPRSDLEKFDIISLSLVLNFVPDPTGRGQMLLRTLDFLHAPATSKVGKTGACPAAPQPSSFTPGLFLVLPSPCVSNSRYLDEPKLGRIMASLGYTLVQSKTTQRLVYYLWKRTSMGSARREAFPKKELRSGSSRNNFAIVLEG